MKKKLGLKKMSKNKLQPNSQKLKANNGVQILPGPITSKERVAGSLVTNCS